MEREEPSQSFIDRIQRNEALEVKGQYTSAIIFFIKEAVALRKDHAYFDALSHLRTVIAFIVKASDEDREALEEPVKLLHEIERLANSIDGPTLEIRQASVDLFKNEAARVYFDPVLEYIQDRLKAMGVYSAFTGRARIDPNVIDLVPEGALDRY